MNALFSSLWQACRNLGADLWRWRPVCSTERLILLVSLFFVLACNGLFWQTAMTKSTGGLSYLVISLFLMLLGIHAFLLGLIVWGRAAKLVLSALLLVTILAADYISRFHVYLDASILRSVLLTEPKEAAELITPALLWPLLSAALAITLLWRVRLQPRSWGRALAWRSGFLVLSLAMVLGGALMNFQDLSALMRNNKELRYLVTPANYLVGVPRVWAGMKPAEPVHRQQIGTDAVAMPQAEGSKPRLLVVVAGETARAQNWGLNGYERQTTPQLAARDDVINFSDVHSCGTNTEVSLPCMFSPFGRRDGYDEEKIRGHQSLLHLLEQVGISTLWRDNQTGCKGVCDGLPTQRMDDVKDAELCADGRCMDEIMLKGLAEEVRSKPGDRVIVLHQLGNHGPAYYQRYQAAQRQFVPTCDTAEIGQCAREAIVNTYDNALLATDQMLVRTIELLQGMTDYRTAMIYVSDHGESLGEKGLYLHGVPYAIAPAEQTRVPMVMWFSPEFAQSRGLDLGCVRQRATQYADHDNLFSSILGLMQVSTRLRDPQLDLFAGCAPDGA